MRLFLAVSALAVVTIASSAPAALIIHETPAGADINGLPVSASATLTTSAGHITLVLENLQADPKGVAQNLSGFFFTISTGQTAGTLSSSSSVPRTVASDGTYTDDVAVAAGWLLSTSGDELQLNVLGTPIGPAHTLIGPPHASGEYKTAKGSIAGNGPHNPFLAESATFELDVPGVTANSRIPHVTFAFNTTPGDTITTPEPTTMGLLALGGLAALKRRRKRL